MTDERLDQILKQALAPEIDDTEIQIWRKVRNSKMSMRKRVVAGLVACAALTLVVSGGYFGGISKNVGDGTAGANDVHNVASNNFFAITAYAAEVPDGVASGEVEGLNTTVTYGGGGYLQQRFAISGQNIAKVKVSTDKCEVYTVSSVYPGEEDFEKAQSFEKSGLEDFYGVYDGETEEEASILYYEHLQVAGQVYEGVYDSNMLFGMYVPEELWNTNDDIKSNDHEDINQVNGATLSIEVTFADGSIESHNYRLNTGRIFVPVDEAGNCRYDSLTRFLTQEEEATETCNIYGYLMEKID